MLRRICAVGLAAGAATILAIVVPASGASGASHTVKLTLHSFTISSTSKTDSPGTKQTGVGLLTGKPFGQAVSATHDKVTSASRSEIKFAGETAIYTVNGGVTGKLHLVVKPNSSGGATGSGTLTVTSGTGRYQGAKGTLTFTGSQTASQPDFTAHIKGSLSY